MRAQINETQFGPGVATGFGVPSAEYSRITDCQAVVPGGQSGIGWMAQSPRHRFGQNRQFTYHSI